jgi:hypothetical protein
MTYKEFLEMLQIRKKPRPGSIKESDIYEDAVTGKHIAPASIGVDKITFNPYIIGVNDLDDVVDGGSYAKILSSAAQNGLVLLSQAVGNIDNIGDGSTYKKVLATDISAGHILLSSVIGTLDNIADGTSYGKVAITDIQAGHILLAETVGNLDDIADGSNYGKVALTSISAGKIIVAGLDSGVTARMFADSTTKTNIEAWRHASDVTLIDGGDIYTGTVTAAKIAVGIFGSGNELNNGNFEDWTAGTTVAPDAWTLGGSGTIAREGTTKKIGNYSAKMTMSGSPVWLGQYFHAEKGIDYWKGRTATFSCWVYATQGNTAVLNLNDGSDYWSSYHTGDSTWQLLTITHTISGSATSVGLAIHVRNYDATIYFDGAMLVEGSYALPYADKIKNWGHPSDYTLIDGGDIYTGTVTLSKLSFVPFIIASDDLDDIAEGTNYGKVLKADISAGHILLSACSGNLDNIADGSSYGKVALTSISAGKIIVAGLDSGVTARMFADATTKTNIEAWRHASDVTLIDGGDIYTKSITAIKLDIATITDNLILNPSFEQVGGWALTEGSGTAIYSTADKTEGTYSLLLPPPPVGYGCRAIPLVPGDKYTIRIKLRGVTATAAGLVLNMNNKSTYPAGDYVTAALRDSYTLFCDDAAVPLTWTTYEYTYTVPANVYWGSFCIYVNEAGPAGGVYIDEAEVRKQLGAVHIEDGVINAAKLKLTQSGNDEVLDIYQGASTDQIFKIRSTSVDHQITSGEGLWGTDTDCFAYLRKLYPVFGAYDGGLHINSFTEDTAPISFQVYAVFGAASTAKDGSATGAINLAGLKADPTNHTYKACATNENIFCLRTKPPGGAYQAVFIVDCDGDVLYDGTAGAFQAEDDIALVQELEDVLSDKIDRKKMKDKDISKKHKVVHVSEWKDEKGEGFSRFVSSKKLNLLLLGSIRQLNEKILTLENRIKILGA